MTGKVDLSYSHRVARRDDMPALKTVMDAAMRALLPAYLSEDEVEASFAIMGLDSQLIDDGTYFVIESDGCIAGCGGWSQRATLFGGDHSAGRDALLLDTTRDAARVRAMYTNPQFARRGVGRRILELCERAAALGGFRRVELAATLSGLPLYRACGYEEVEPFFADTPSGIRVPLVRMSKTFGPAG
jgi:GNAT superfamily N-acetyltransferase